MDGAFKWAKGPRDPNGDGCACARDGDAPVEPTPGPVEPTPGPVEPTPGPVEPTPGPVEPNGDPPAQIGVALPGACLGTGTGYDPHRTGVRPVSPCPLGFAERRLHITQSTSSQCV